MLPRFDHQADRIEIIVEIFISITPLLETLIAIMARLDLVAKFRCGSSRVSGFDEPVPHSIAAASA